MDGLTSSEGYCHRDDLFTLIEAARQETGAQIIYVTNGKVVVRYHALHPPEYSVSLDLGKRTFYADDDESLSGYNLGTVRGAARFRQLARRIGFSSDRASEWEVVAVEQRSEQCMVKLYATAVIAFGRQGNFAHIALAALAETEEQAQHIALQDGKRFLPSSEGWHDHVVATFTIPHKAIEDYRRANGR